MNKWLGEVDIIPYRYSVYFIDRERKYWYFQYENDGTLWWRYHFFMDFFNIFSMEIQDYETILGEWVEEKLNLSNIKIKPVKTDFCLVDEVLDYKVKVTAGHFGDTPGKIEDILNNID
jgi:hypothetical protein